MAKFFHGKRKYYPLGIFLLGLAGSSFLGLLYSNNSKLLNTEKKLQFTLLDSNSRAFQFPNSKSIFIHFMPDLLTKNITTTFKNMIEKMKTLKNIVLISRKNVIFTMNVKRLTGFSGTILTDPSASVLSQLDSQFINNKTKEWISVYADKQGRVQWVHQGKEPVWDVK